MRTEIQKKEKPKRNRDKKQDHFASFQELERSATHWNSKNWNEVLHTGMKCYTRSAVP